MNSTLNFIIRGYKFVKRNWPSILCTLIWYFVIKFYLDNPDRANWPFAVIVTTILIYTVTSDKKKEEKYQDIKQNLKLLYKEYVFNIDLAGTIDYLSKKQKIEELPFGMYLTKFIEKVIEEDMIKDKILAYEISSDFKRLIGFNRVWIIFIKGLLLGNKNLEKGVRDYIKYNKEAIYPKITKTNELLRTYFEKKYNEELKIQK